MKTKSAIFSFIVFSIVFQTLNNAYGAPVCSGSSISTGTNESCTAVQLGDSYTVSNIGTIQGQTGTFVINNALYVVGATNVKAIDNYGTINAPLSNALYVGLGNNLGGLPINNGNPTVTVFNNNGLIESTQVGVNAIGASGGTIETINNFVNGTISKGIIINAGVYTGFAANGKIGTLNNWGIISGGDGATAISIGAPLQTVTASITTLNNYGTITSSSTNPINNLGTINTINNSGQITATSLSCCAAIANQGKINNIINTGTISSVFANTISNSGQIGTITNIGTLSSGTGYFGIRNGAGSGTIGTIDTLNNGGTLTYGATGNVAAVLPANYNIIVYSPNNYGKLVAPNSATGNSNFGVYSGGVSNVQASILLPNTKYQNVISGINSIANFTNTAGNYQGVPYSLSQNGSTANSWDLVTGRYNINGNTPLVQALNSIGNTTTQSMSALTSTLGSTTESQLTASLSQLAPLLSGATVWNTMSLLTSINDIVVGKSLQNFGFRTGELFLNDRSNHAIWVKPFGGLLNQGNKNNAPGFSANNYGFVLGADFLNDKDLGLGASFALANSNVSSNSNSTQQSLRTDLYQMTGYGKYSISNKLLATFQASVGLSTNSGTRSIDFMASNASANYNGTTASLGTSIFLPVNIYEGFNFIPSARFDYSLVRNNAYSETNALHGLGLNVNSQSYETSVFNINGKLVNEIDDYSDAYINFGIGYNFSPTATSVSAGFQGAPSIEFFTYGVNPGAVMGQFGLGYSKTMNDDLTIGVAYNANFQSQYLNQTILASGRISF